VPNQKFGEVHQCKEIQSIGKPLRWAVFGVLSGMCGAGAGRRRFGTGTGEPARRHHLRSVPVQLRRQSRPDRHGSNRTTLNLQPIVPFALDNGANIITRTIIPYHLAGGRDPRHLPEVGLAISWQARGIPEPQKTSLTWGIGPVLRIPTNSDVSGETWAAGITGIVEADRPLDLRCAGQPPLGLRERSNDADQRDLRPTFRRLLDRDCVDLLASERNHLRLGGRKLVCAGKRLGVEAGDHQRHTRQFYGGRRLLAGKPRWWTARLAVPPAGSVRASKGVMLAPHLLLPKNNGDYT
jgi:hypothetical protein